MTDDKDEDRPFNQWCYRAKDPEGPLLFGQPPALLTVALHMICNNEPDRFNIALRHLEAAFDAGREQGLRDAETQRREG